MDFYVSDLLNFLYPYLCNYFYSKMFYYYHRPWGYTTDLTPDYSELMAVLATAASAIQAVNGKSYFSHSAT